MSTFGNTALDRLMVESGLLSAVPAQVIEKEVSLCETGKRKPRRPQVKPPRKPEGGYELPPWFARFEHAMTISSKKGACLFGPRGTGKTSAVHYLAKVTSTPLVTFQAAAGCTLDDLVGVRDLKDGSTVFTPGPLPEALEKDCWLCIEEANAMHPAVFSKLNTLTDGSGDSLALPDGTRLKAGKKFRVVLCFNEGSSYSGTREVNAALRDRLKPIYADYLPAETEARILVGRMGCDQQTAKQLVSFANKVRASRAELGFDLSPRCLFDILESIRDLGTSWKDTLEYCVLDLIGDPVDKAPQRQIVKAIADLEGFENYGKPIFEELTSESDTEVSQSETTQEQELAA